MSRSHPTSSGRRLPLSWWHEKSRDEVGWSKEEFTRLGEPWLEHGERYRRSEEFIRVLRGLWSEEEFSSAGSFYWIDRARLRPKPVHQPMVFQGGNARAMAGRVSDVLLMNGDTNAGFSRIIHDTRRAARLAGRSEDELRFGANAFCIVRQSENEAIKTLHEIVHRANRDAVSEFANAVRQAGQSTVDHEGMWTDSVFEDLVQYNDGFKTDLIGAASQVADRIIELRELGVNIILCGFLHYEWELQECSAPSTRTSSSSARVSRPFSKSSSRPRPRTCSVASRISTGDSRRRSRCASAPDRPSSF